VDAPERCPACGSEDEHAEWRSGISLNSCGDLCPHTGAPGHGTGCSCGGRVPPDRPFRLSRVVGQAAVDADLFPILPSPDVRALRGRVAGLEAEVQRLGNPDPPGPDELRRILRRCAIVVREGETLVIRAPRDFTPNQLREYQQWLDDAHECGEISFKVFAVMAEELGVIAQAEPAA